MHNKKLLVVGSLNMDLVISVPRIPKAGETILGYKFKTSAGGKGANQAYAAARLGCETYMIGCVGSDEYGRKLIDNLSSAGVDIRGVEPQPDANTGIAFICVGNDGENSIAVARGANERCCKEYIIRHMELMELCDIVLMQCEIPFDTVSFVVDTAHKMNKTVILNPAPAPEDLPGDLLGKTDIITPNESELYSLTGIRIRELEDVRKASELLINRGARSVLVTLGKNGAALAAPGAFTHYPALDVKAVDTTAAGDAFSAAFAAALSEGGSYGEAAGFANRVAAITVSREGAQTSIPSREEVG